MRLWFARDIWRYRNVFWLIDCMFCILAVCSQKLIDKVQRVMSCAAWLIFSGDRRCHVSPVHRDHLHCLRAHEPVTVKLSLVVLNALWPSYIHKMLVPRFICRFVQHTSWQSAECSNILVLHMPDLNSKTSFFLSPSKLVERSPKQHPKVVRQYLHSTAVLRPKPTCLSMSVCYWQYFWRVFETVCICITIIQLYCIFFLFSLLLTPCCEDHCLLYGGFLIQKTLVI